MAFKERGEEWKEYDNAVHWMLVTFFICLGITVALFIFALPLSYLVGHGISKSSFAMINKFLSLIIEKPDHLWAMYAKWFRQIIHYRGAFSLSLWIPILPFITCP